LKTLYLTLSPFPPQSLSPEPCTLHPTPWTLHPTSWTLHLTPWTLPLTPWTLHPEPWTLHPEFYTLNPETRMTLDEIMGHSWVKRQSLDGIHPLSVSDTIDDQVRS